MRCALRLLSWAILPVLLGCGGGGPGPAPAPVTAFVVHATDADFVPPKIVLHHDAASGVGFDWETIRARATSANLKVFYRDDEMLAWGAAAYLEEGIRRLTGLSLVVESGPDIDRGIVLLTLAGAPESLRTDPEVVAALSNTGGDDYNPVEAYYIRTEPDRVLVLANGASGLIDAVVELLESVDYEVLGMGPDWIHAPDRSDGLSFDLRVAGRPSWYLRSSNATSGQYYGVGTVYSPSATPLTDPDDEYVDQSYWRWRVGTRTWAESMPGFPGHALQAFHRKVVAEMISRGTSQGFLAETDLGLDADRPPAGGANAGRLWINTDPEGMPGADRAFVSDGATWNEVSPTYLPFSLDLSVGFVRELVLEAFMAGADAWFADHPDDLYVYGTEPEDGGGYGAFAARVADPTWYPDYRAGLGDPLGAPYALHGQFDLDQPLEVYDPTSVADCVYGFNDWLLREYDGRLALRPADERVTSTGHPKGELVRTSFYSYNYHDVPPGFHPDPRMRIMVAGYPKNRGRGRWHALATSVDVAAAMKVLLPREPSASYGIWSLAYYQDFGVDGVVPLHNTAAETLRAPFASYHAAGMRGFSYETDFNHGKHGLGYYLLPRLLWDATLDAAAVDALRDRWFRRAFGSGWEPMKAYYDLRTPEAWFANTEQLWATAVELIDEADALIDPDVEPAAKRRLDDVKQMWWYHYLTVSGRAVDGDPDMETFAWKGQMAYQVAEHVVLRRIFGQNLLDLALDPALLAEPAHYTAEETAAWWAVVQDAWERVPVTDFADVTLADGTAGADVDVNDLVWTDELVAAGSAIGITTDRTFWFNAGYQGPVSLLVTAAEGEDVGFSLGWTEDVERFPSCGIERWDPFARAWMPLVDPLTTKVAPTQELIAYPGATGWVARYAIPAPVAGTYRVEIGQGGNGAQGTGVGYDYTTSSYAAPRPCTYHRSQAGLTQYASAPHAFVYIPRGVPSLDLELLFDNGGTVELFTRGVVTGEAFTSRAVTLGARGTTVIPLLPGEDGGIAAFTFPGFLFPVLYSVPKLWARSPTALLVPRQVAEADGLTVR